MQYIHEFPHPRVIVHYHPVGGEQFALAHVQFALVHKVHAIELDLHYRESDGQIVVNHDSATAVSPTLEQVIQLILYHANGETTVHHDDLQFFLVLEPKENEQRLFEGIIQVLKKYTSYLSTAVNQGDPPRGITVVITGDFPLNVYASFDHNEINPLFILEFVDYGAEIVNLSADQTPFQWATFQWVEIRQENDRGRVKLLRSGADPLLQGKYNVRVWDCGWDELGICMATEADAINIDRGEVEAFQEMIRRYQEPG